MALDSDFVIKVLDMSWHDGKLCAVTDFAPRKCLMLWIIAQYLQNRCLTERMVQKKVATKAIAIRGWNHEGIRANTPRGQILPRLGDLPWGTDPAQDHGGRRRWSLQPNSRQAGRFDELRHGGWKVQRCLSHQLRLSANHGTRSLRLRSVLQESFDLASRHAPVQSLWQWRASFLWETKPNKEIDPNASLFQKN